MLRVSLREPASSLQERVAIVTLWLLTLSVVFGGPLGLTGRGERHLLLAILLVVALIELIRSGLAPVLQFVRAQPIVLAPALFVGGNLAWVVGVGFENGAYGLSLAAQDAQSLLVPLVFTLVFIAYRLKLRLWFQLMRWMVIMAAVLAGIQTCIWLLLSIHPVPQKLIENAEAIIFGTNEGVNILRQTNAGVWYTRVVWISSYCLVPCYYLAPIGIRRPILLLSAQTLIAIAIIISYTKGMWLAVIMGGVVLLLSVAVRRRGSLNARLLTHRALLTSVTAILLAGAATNCAAYVTGEGSAIYARLSVPVMNSSVPDDEGVFDRVQQTLRLIEMWKARPWFGHGYGAYIPDLVRHQDRPFIYEMVPFALLMKLGGVGFGLYCGFLAFVSYRLWSLSADGGVALALVPAFVAYVCQIHTNPVFFSFTGMFIFSILLSLWLSVEVGKTVGNINVR